MAKEPSTAPTVAPMIMPVRWLVVEFTVLVEEGKRLGGELDVGWVILVLEDKKRSHYCTYEWIAVFWRTLWQRQEGAYLLFVTLSVIDSTSKRVGESPWRNVMPNVDVCDSGRLSAMRSWLMLVLTWFVIVTINSMSTGVNEMKCDTPLKVKNNWGTKFPDCGIGPVVVVTITGVPLVLRHCDPARPNQPEGQVS